MPIDKENVYLQFQSSILNGSREIHIYPIELFVINGRTFQIVEKLRYYKKSRRGGGIG